MHAPFATSDHLTIWQSRAFVKRVAVRLALII